LHTPKHRHSPQAGPFPIFAAGVYKSFFGCEDLFQNKSVLPAITKVIEIHGLSIFRSEVLRDLLLPAWQDAVIIEQRIFFRKTDFLLMPGHRILDMKGVQMSIQPAHHILNGYVEIPEGVILRDQEPAPNGRSDPLESNLKLVNPSRWSSCHSSPLIAHHGIMHSDSFTPPAARDGGMISLAQTLGFWKDCFSCCHGERVDMNYSVRELAPATAANPLATGRILWFSCRYSRQDF